MTKTPPKPPKKRATIIPPDTRLKDKLGRENKLDQFIDPIRVTMAQNIVSTNREVFMAQVTEDMKGLEEAYRYIMEHEDALIPAIQTIYAAAFRIKGLAGTFDYTLASAVAKHLYSYLEHRKTLTAFDRKLIEAHITTLNIIFKKNIKGDGGEVGKQLYAGLTALVSKER